MDSLFILLLFVLVLSIFLGFELINKVPSTLHTPLMSEQMLSQELLLLVLFFHQGLIVPF